MGSGHFLVGFVDYLADRVIAAMAEAEGALEGYVSPLVEDIDTVLPVWRYRPGRRPLCVLDLPIVERQETNEYGRFRSRDLCLAYLNALSAGRPDAEPDL